MTTLIPTFILAMLGNPAPQDVQMQLDAQQNVICWSTQTRSVCFGYNDEGTHLVVPLNAQE